MDLIHAPRLADYRCPLLLYADDAAILSFSRVGLLRALKILSAYCTANQLHINHSKSKIMIFARSRKIYHWKLDGIPVEQVHRFQYLGILFQSNTKWPAQIKSLCNKAKISTHALLHFFHTEGAHHIPSALKVYRAKVIAAITYGASLWVQSNISSLETVHNQFLRRLMGVPPCVSNAAIRLELGISSLATILWKRAIGNWLSLWTRLSTYYLGQCLWRDPFHSPWARSVHTKLLTIGISPIEAFILGPDAAKSMIFQRLDDIDRQSNLTHGSGTCSPFSLDIAPSSHPPPYLSALHSIKHRLAFMKARFNVIPSNVLDSRLSGGAKTNYCSCDGRSPESLFHITFVCPHYRDIRSKFISSIFQRFPGPPDRFSLRFLLQDTDSNVTLKVAKFFAAVVAEKNRGKRRTSPTAEVHSY